MSYYSFLQYVLLFSKSVLLVSVFYLNFAFLGYLIGPVLFWYFRSVLTDSPRLRIRDLWHLLPAALIITITLPYLFGSYSLKVDIATSLVEDIGNLRMIRISALYDFIPLVLVYVSRPLLVLTYAFWSAGMLIRFVRRRKTSSVFSGQNYMIQWLSALLSFFFILVISHFILMARVYLFNEFNIFSALSILTVISGIGFAGLLISPFFFPGILYGLPRISDTATSRKENVKEGKRLLPEEIKTNNMTFESEYIKHIQHKVISCMEEYQPYLQADCNLVYLSKLLEMPVHHLAFYFRAERKQPFNDFRNEYRIKHAKELIRQGNNKVLTLEAIGVLSGFSTRNTFYTSFKKVEGISPGTFANQVMYYPPCLILTIGKTFSYLFVSFLKIDTSTVGVLL